MVNLFQSLTDAGCWMQDAGCRMQDAGCKMQDARCRMQDAGCRMQDAGCRMQDAGCCNITTGIPACIQHPKKKSIYFIVVQKNHIFAARFPELKGIQY
ncbi:MAG: hypothetical protein M0Q38_17525 [Bacteroidales bacterium]|nr:hypothetical protein [Bacteroidales bacterium]